jgi:hypothetical protein
VTVSDLLRALPGVNLRLSVSNLTAPKRTSVSERYASGTLDTRETSTTDGVRMVMLTLEKKW